MRPASAEPLKIGYSDWPGWVAWQVAIDKGWLKEAGRRRQVRMVRLLGLDGRLRRRQDRRRLVTNGDALVTGAGGAKSVMILLTDYSNGNDMIVAQARHQDLKELKGKKIGLEIGFVEHLLLLQGLQKNGMTRKRRRARQRQDQRDAAGAGLRPGRAIGAWQPNSGQAMKARSRLARRSTPRRKRPASSTTCLCQPGEPRARTRTIG